MEERIAQRLESIQGMSFRTGRRENLAIDIRASLLRVYIMRAVSSYADRGICIRSIYLLISV